MTEPLRVLPDIEAEVISYLLDVPEVTALVGQRVYADAPEGVRYPFILVRDIAPTAESSPYWLARALLQVEGWGVSRPEARDVCAFAVAALMAMPMDAAGDATVTATQVVSGPRSIPDQITPMPRFMADVRVTYHPSGSGS